jgi:2-phosphoglycerate kinase
VSEGRKRDPSPLGGEHGLPYSKGLMARALMAVGVPAARAYSLARRVENDLTARGVDVADFSRLEELAIEILGEEEGGEAVRQLRRYRELRELDVPILLLIGGATGTGKSTVATEVAYRLGITRVTSTDFVRQTMRAFFSHEFMPTIHYSSFEAGQGLPAEEQETGDPVILGFLEQTRNVLAGVRASIDRALDEGWSMVLEGVHIVPGMCPLPLGRALAIECVLAIRDEKIHASHFYTRSLDSEERRPVDKYLDRLREIRRLQRYIVDRAERADVPVIANDNTDAAVTAVMELVVSAAERAKQAGAA